MTDKFGGGIKDRRQVRLFLKKDVLINKSVKGYALDMSKGGMFVYTHVPFPKDNLIELRFTLNEGEPPVVLMAQVRFLQAGVGLGVVFVNADGSVMERLNKFIEENLDAHPLGENAANIDKRKKILLVDDSAGARTTYKNRLVLANFAVRESASGMEAFQQIEKEKPDLILLDVVMEEMSGMRFLQLLRANPEWQYLRVVILSGKITPQEAQMVCSFGVENVFSKMTTTPAKLAELIKNILGS
ncbi:MAG: response regulator [Nitrosomonadales bacterium]|nr:response regulator [Nitrosomonadales bacterium]MBI5901981.1 response regulator [Deltaproteobacteria bacterium]